MDNNMQHFIADMRVLHLSVLDKVNEGLPQPYEIYTASCFYAFDMETIGLVFKSQEHTKHIQLAKLNPIVGVNIALDSNVLQHIKGIQAKAEFTQASKEQENIYYTRFPFARLGDGTIWNLKILWAKYTDNSLLLGHKIEFNC